MNKALLFAGILFALALSTYTHSLVLEKQVMPTFGNTMIHVASARNLVEHGEYPLYDDFSYGGGVPNSYVPLYRFDIAGIAWLTGQSLDFVGRLIVMVIALLVPLGFFAAGKELYDDNVGLAAAILSTLAAELLIYTVRPLPQAVGLALLPIGIYLLARGKMVPALVITAGITLVHQEAAIFWVAGCFGFGVLSLINDYFTVKKIVLSGNTINGLSCWALGAFGYIAWHWFVTGNPYFWKLAQFTYKEGNPVSWELLLAKTGGVLLLFAGIGLVKLAYDIMKTKVTPQQLILISFMLTGLFAVKNDVVGIGVFMDRFIVFLQIPLIILSALGLAGVITLLSGLTDKTFSRLTRIKIVYSSEES